ncbi:unnamed protein product [Didymodactylos carnosus]|uniref:MULE transposase domain-containing protein n=1 Tax=Didymodactylos carnosus TaxID=1234261 RepID=A0A814KPV7_9BILA|nr:unnamed protein product [Didymodactylos carnosus]CAF3821969.1 unnamed protein product [Didymodactylos carnosus]
MATFSVSTTEKSKPLLLLNGYNYIVDRSNGSKIYWKCDQARKASCKGRVHTDNPSTTILYESDNHNHFGNAVSSDIRRFEENVRFRALNTNEGTQSILDNCLRNLIDETVARLPVFNHVKRNIQNQRKNNDLPTILHDKTFEKIPDKLCVTLRNNHVTPTMFYQLYAIHVLYKDSVIPTVFALLPNKTQQTYQRLINETVQCCPWWSPDSIMMDFERAAYNAFRGSFVTTSLSGCFFHLQNSIQRKVQGLGFKTNYETDPIFARNAHKISALAFLPVSDVGQGFDDLYNALPSLYQPLLNYFEDTYLAESWHRRLSSVMQCQYPSLWSFITSLQNEEHYIHCQTIKLHAGQKIAPNKKYLEYSKRLRHLIMHPEASLLQQLDGLAHNI